MIIWPCKNYGPTGRRSAPKNIASPTGAASCKPASMCCTPPAPGRPDRLALQAGLTTDRVQGGPQNAPRVLEVYAPGLATGAASFNTAPSDWPRGQCLGQRLLASLASAARTSGCGRCRWGSWTTTLRASRCTGLPASWSSAAASASLSSFAAGVTCCCSNAAAPSSAPDPQHRAVPRAGSGHPAEAQPHTATAGRSRRRRPRAYREGVNSLAAHVAHSGDGGVVRSNFPRVGRCGPAPCRSRAPAASRGEEPRYPLDRPTPCP